MKKHTRVKYLPKIALLVCIITVLFSCSKEDPYIQKFDDVFDVSGVNEINTIVTSAQSAEDLASAFSEISFEIPEAIQKISLEEMVQHYENNIKLSSDEIDMLLKNDSETYMKVINRFGSLPSEFNITKTDVDQIKSGDLGKYLVSQKEECKNFYSDDYYSAILAYQNFIKSSIIEPVKSAQIFAGENLKSANGGGPPGPEDEPNGTEIDDTIIGYTLIVINNNWVMWWTYYNDGTRTKHKGAVGDTTYPGY